ncbi:MAG TPA: hypothetical protein VKA21_14120 [Candidatus Binatia bacterium]|nr:hypothetical protein [Candidatus Binatia bacterium]
MDTTAALLARLDRIEALEQRDAPPRELLAELRALVVEAEAWARREGDERSLRAVDACRSALEPAPLLHPAFRNGW